MNSAQYEKDHARAKRMNDMLKTVAILAVLALFGILIIVAILRIPFCLYHSFTPRYDAPLICTIG